MTAETPRVGDTVRITSVRDAVVTTVTGPVTEAPRGLWVGGVYCLPLPDGWTVDVIERAAPPEPPIGSIVAMPGSLPWFRGHDGLWRQAPSDEGYTWSNFGTFPRLVILREGWGT